MIITKTSLAKVIAFVVARCWVGFILTLRRARALAPSLRFVVDNIHRSLFHVTRRLNSRVSFTGKSTVSTLEVIRLSKSVSTNLCLPKGHKKMYARSWKTRDYICIDGFTFGTTRRQFNRLFVARPFPCQVVGFVIFIVTNSPNTWDAINVNMS